MSAPISIKPAKPAADSLADSHDYLAPVAITPSTWLLWGQAVVIALMMLLSGLAMAPHLSTQPLWWLALGCFWCLLALGGYSAWWSHRHGPSRLRYQKGHWYVTLDGVDYQAELAGSPVIRSWLLVARYRLRAGMKVTFVGLPDNLEPDEFRRLRVWLRIHLTRAGE